MFKRVMILHNLSNKIGVHSKKLVSLDIRPILLEYTVRSVNN